MLKLNYLLKNKDNPSYTKSAGLINSVFRDVYKVDLWKYNY